ncbi:MAG TPA: hypothetical protein PK733_04095 [Clostridiales bacterium]|nr:hypothetical protein [Clostridiales bacterium]
MEIKKNKIKDLNFRSIKITRHSIEQYYKRVEQIDETAVKDKLLEVLENGNIVTFKPTLRGKETNKYDLHIEHDGIGITAVYQEDVITIVTCTGSKEYRKWFKQQEIKLPRHIRRAA